MPREIADAAGAEPPEVNLGGGFGIPYFPGEQPLDIDRGRRGARQRPSPTSRISLANTRFAIELGRWLVGEAGVYLTRIIDRKVSGGRTFLVTDGGLHHMLAASGNFGQLLRRNYPVAIAGRFGASPTRKSTVTGCLCTPLDLLADEVALPTCRSRATGRDLLRRRLRADAPARRPSSASPRRGKCWSRDRSPRRNTGRRAGR